MGHGCQEEAVDEVVAGLQKALETQHMSKAQQQQLLVRFWGRPEALVAFINTPQGPNPTIAS